jgi:membrane-bound serine protease (ClpP class)
MHWMNVFTLVIILQLVGIVVVVAEIILPSGGLLSLLAAGIFGYSLYLAFHDISTASGMAFFLADLVLMPLLIYFGLKMLVRSPATLRTTLSSSGGVTSQSAELEQFRGREGEAFTDLHPSGTALIGNRRLDVVSRGEYIVKGSAVTVVDITGNQVIVSKKEP